MNICNFKNLKLFTLKAATASIMYNLTVNIIGIPNHSNHCFALETRTFIYSFTNARTWLHHHHYVRHFYISCIKKKKKNLQGQTKKCKCGQYTSCSIQLIKQTNNKTKPA